MDLFMTLPIELMDNVVWPFLTLFEDTLCS